MRIYKTRPFFKWAKNEGINDSDLLAAISEMTQGYMETG